MPEILTWGALIAAGGSVIAIITFWMNRGKAEGEALLKAESAQVAAGAALAKAEFIAIQLADARVEFARDYASHKDLAAAETRFAVAFDNLRSELRGTHERLDRLIEGQAKHV